MKDRNPAQAGHGNIDWDNLDFTEKAVIVYIRKGNDIVLIEKKTGLGAGKINAPGGRIEKGETPYQCAERECIEEVCVKPVGLREMARLSFLFTDGYSLFGHVFTAEGYEGELAETDEAKPFLCSSDSLPYDRMWEDDILWLPHMLAGKPVTGRFVFEGDRMLSYDIFFPEKEF